MRTNESNPDLTEHPIDVALHALAQPLTALSFIIELGRMQSDPAALKEALIDASKECRRAVEKLSQVRDEVRRLMGESE